MEITPAPSDKIPRVPTDWERIEAQYRVAIMWLRESGLKRGITEERDLQAREAGLLELRPGGEGQGRRAGTRGHGTQPGTHGLPAPGAHPRGQR